MFSMKECLPEICVEGKAWVYGLTDTDVCSYFQCPRAVFVNDLAEGFAELPS